jgi:hypothetical protein
MRTHADHHRILKTLALLAALTALLIPSFGPAQKGRKPLSADEIVNLLTGDVPSSDVAQEAQDAGISFQVTADVAKRIRDAGGTESLINTLRSLAPRGTAPVTPPPRPEPVPSSPPTLNVQSSPGQCQVYVDDSPVGSTSQQGRLRLTHLGPGQHSVRVSSSGYQDSEQTITLQAGQVTTIVASLQHIEAPPVVPQPIPEPPPNPEPEPQPVIPARQAGYLGVLPAQQQPEGTRGVVISGAQAGGPAAQAGLKAYDTILTVNGQPATTPQDLRAMLGAHAAGEIVQITWTSGNRTFTRQIRLATPPAQAQITPQPPPVPSLRTPHRGVVTFNVAHDHGQSGQAYCTGVLAIGNGVIYYKGVRSTGVGGVHNYEIILETVKEARRNTVYLMALGAFHIRTRKGTNYNFVVVNDQGQFQPPDQVLEAIDAAQGK